MKAVFVGGGSHRLLNILRGAMAERAIFDGGEIALYDLNRPRAEAMGRVLMQTPEYARIRCKITWNTSLEKALDGADAVSVILMAGSQPTFRRGDEASLRHGFLGSDNVSPNGAFLAAKGTPILMDLARKMERLCPKAWLLDFANPVGVLSGMINNHTKIKALGVCAGFTNHQWDLSRVMGTDKACSDFLVDAAGINHLSFIVKGSLRGKDLFKLLDQHITANWKLPRPAPWYHSKGEIQNWQNSVRNLVRVYRDLGVLIFSTEGDGMIHLFYEEALAKALRNNPPRSRGKILAGIKQFAEARRKADEEFRSLLNKDPADAFWAKPAPMNPYGTNREDIFVKLLTGIAGVRKMRVVTSRLNEGAVAGFKDRTVLEYSQIIQGNAIKPAGHFAVPDVVHGIVSALATHQTMLGDALATNDPHLFAHALLAYPVRPYSPAARNLYKELARINVDEISPALCKVVDYL